MDTLVYNSNYTVLRVFSDRGRAMDDARRRAGGEEATCKIVRERNAVIAIYEGPGGKFCAADETLRPAFI